jgi:hypothetical protein
MTARRNGSARTPSSVQVVQIPANVPVTVRFLAGYQGLLTHWLNGRSWPCAGPVDCPAAQHRARTLWRGYAPGETWDQTQRLWFPGVVPLTEALEEVLRGRELRGEVWLLTRHQEGKKQGTVEGMYCETQEEATVSQPFDIVPILLRFYHCSSLLLGVPNPMPAKVVIPPAAAPAPKLPAGLEQAAPTEATQEQRKLFSERLKNLKSKGAAAANGEAHSNGSNGDGNGRHG